MRQGRKKQNILWSVILKFLLCMYVPGYPGLYNAQTCDSYIHFMYVCPMYVYNCSSYIHVMYEYVCTLLH